MESSNSTSEKEADTAAQRAMEGKPVQISTFSSHVGLSRNLMQKVEHGTYVSRHGQKLF